MIDASICNREADMKLNSKPMIITLTIAAIVTTGLAHTKANADTAIETVPTPASSASITTATATLIGTDGSTLGHATLTQMGAGVQIVLEATLPPGTSAFHIHETGACDTPDFKSAGGHFNPHGHDHGLEAKTGHHAGDMPNLIIPENGALKTTVLNKTVTLNTGKTALLDEDGSALVIHTAADDHVSNPSGNAGARIACGIIKAK